jgi:YjbE family integral membrane protein
MEEIFTADFWVRWLKIVGIDLLLAGDNALVIALAVRTLPPRQQLLGRLWGTAGAVGLRLIFIAFMSLLMGISFLQFVAGAVLVWVALKLIMQEGGEHTGGREGTSLRDAIWVIIVADVSMSLDNVIAITGAAEGDMLLVTFGIALSIPLVVWGSGFLARLMNRAPWIIWLGGGLLGEIAGNIMLHDPLIRSYIGEERADAINLPVRISLFVAIAALGWWRARAARARAQARLSHDAGV